MTPALLSGGITPAACSAVAISGLSNPTLQLFLTASQEWLMGLEFFLGRAKYQGLSRVGSTLSSLPQRKLECMYTFKLKRLKRSILSNSCYLETYVVVNWDCI